jgi:hypothetical protein
LLPDNTLSEVLMVKSLTPRGPNGYFPKGVSGNPGGRPHAEREMVELARAAGPDVIRLMIKVCADESRPMPIRLHAGALLLDRGFGKARERVDITADSERAELVQALRIALRSGYLRTDVIDVGLDDVTGELTFSILDDVDRGL